MASGLIGAGLGTVIYVGRNPYISGGTDWGMLGGAAQAAGVGFAIGSGLALLSTPAQVVSGHLSMDSEYLPSAWSRT